MAIQSKMSRGPIGAPEKGAAHKSSHHWPWIILVIVLVLGGGLWFQSAREGTPAATTASSGEYQAVFLDNAQVYFGKLDQSDDEFFILTDVYYLQTGAVNIDQISNLSLTKLGNEAHGPEDRMQINKDHILFIEDMKPESKVVRAILEYKSSN